MKILIVDDHPLVRAGIRVGLRRHFDDAEFVEAGTLSEGTEAVEQGDVDVAILDLRLGDETGLRIAKLITDANMATRCVVLTSVATPRALISAFQTGSVSAFLEKSHDVEPLAEAVSAASKGLSMLSHADAREAALTLGREGALDRDLLTPRELDIAELVADGESDAEIASELSLATSTVRNNLSTIYKKLEIDSRTQLAALVWESRSDLDLLA